MNAATFYVGAQVLYGEKRAVVIRTSKRGVRIAFEGGGLQSGRYVHKTVSHKNLTPIKLHTEHGGWE